MQLGLRVDPDGEDAGWADWDENSWDITAELHYPDDAQPTSIQPDEACVCWRDGNDSCVRMTPDEARTIAARLVRAAEACERALP